MTMGGLDRLASAAADEPTDGTPADGGPADDGPADEPTG
jgi:hypothetical protein